MSRLPFWSDPKIPKLILKHDPIHRVSPRATKTSKNKRIKITQMLGVVVCIPFFKKFLEDTSPFCSLLNLSAGEIKVLIDWTWLRDCNFCTKIGWLLSKYGTNTGSTSLCVLQICYLLLDGSLSEKFSTSESHLSWPIWGHSNSICKKNRTQFDYLTSLNSVKQI